MTNKNDQLDRARELFAAGEDLQALTFCTRVLNSSPNDIEANIIKGEILIRLERLDNALDCLNKAISLDSSNAEAYLQKGYALKSKQELIASLEAFDKAVGCFLEKNRSEEEGDKVDQNFKKMAEAYRACAEIATLLGKTQDAVSYLEEAKELDEAVAFAEESLQKSQNTEEGLGQEQEEGLDFVIVAKPSMSTEGNKESNSAGQDEIQVHGYTDSISSWCQSHKTELLIGGAAALCTSAPVLVPLVGVVGEYAGALTVLEGMGAMGLMAL